MIRLALVASAAACLAACRPPATPELCPLKPTEPGFHHAKPRGKIFDPVPLYPPDFEPPELSDPSQIVRVRGTEVDTTGSIIIVLFQDDATQAQRQAAVDSIHGVVVGGWPSAGGPDGFYYVRIAGDSTGDAVDVASNRLTALPQVQFASPDYYLSETTVSSRGPVDGANRKGSKERVVGHHAAACFTTRAVTMPNMP